MPQHSLPYAWQQEGVTNEVVFNEWIGACWEGRISKSGHRFL